MMYVEQTIYKNLPMLVLSTVLFWRFKGKTINLQIEITERSKIVEFIKKKNENKVKRMNRNNKRKSSKHAFKRKKKGEIVHYIDY